MLLLLTGLLALLLLPVGAWLGSTSIVFQGLSGLHLLALVLAAAATLKELLTTAKDQGEYFKLLFAAIWIIILIVFCLHPVTARDALTHHLAIPKLWIEQGTIVSIPWHSWSFYPMLANLAYVSLLHWGLESCTAIYQVLMLICLSGVVHRYLVDLCNKPELGVSGFLVTLTLPALFRLATIPLVDVSLACYTMLAIYLLIRGVEDFNLRSIGLAGIACGLALGTKYNALLACITLGLCLIWFLIRRKISLSRIATILLVLGGTAFLFYLPWLLRNYSSTGNPVYPLFQSKLGGPILPGATALVSPLASRLLVYNESLFDYLLLPLRMIFLGQDDTPKYFDGVLSPLCLLAFIPMLKPKAQPGLGILTGFSVLYFIFAVISAGPRIRYLAPIFGPLCVLTTLGLANIPRIKNFLLAAYLGFSLFYAWNLAGREGLSDYFFSKLTRSDYLASHVPDWSLIDFANSKLPKDSRLYLVLTGNAFYYFDLDVRSAGHFSASELIAWTNSSATPKELSEELQSREITHIGAEIKRLTETLTVALSAEKALLWNSFVQHDLEQIWTDGRFVVWKLR